MNSVPLKSAMDSRSSLSAAFGHYDLNYSQQSVANTSEETELSEILPNVHHSVLQDDEVREVLEPERSCALSADGPLDHHQSKGVWGEYLESSGVTELQYTEHSAQEIKLNEVNFVARQR